MTWLWTICSKVLQHIDVRDTGRYLDALDLSPFLNNGVTYAVFQSSGTFPWSNDDWNMMVSIGDTDVAIAFKKFLLICCLVH